MNTKSWNVIKEKMSYTYKTKNGWFKMWAYGSLDYFYKPIVSKISSN